MFGKKKEITQKFIAKPKEETDQDSSSSPKKDRPRNSVQDNADNNFIFYGSDNKFAKQLEIYATLKEYSNIIQDSKNKKLVLTIVDSNSPMEYLSFKIRDSFSQFPEYQDLEGFTAKNLTKMEKTIMRKTAIQRTFVIQVLSEKLILIIHRIIFISQNRQMIYIIVYSIFV